MAMLRNEFNNFLLFFFSKLITSFILEFMNLQVVQISSAMIHSGRFSFNDSGGAVRLSFFVISLR